ncbi:SOS response-associated peptidase [uncultured Amaricoccus sp.]|uniref:SOS response-associated peptidase n=1 Tax=uncultured Amaricoccus sp. TaxID=339341 RepID=UPI002633EE6A|nr:SOS response-associated peptidase [uncultured Amaricoccus sp.]
MARRTTAQHKIDGAAFPVRVVILVPERGFRGLETSVQRWLDQTVGREDYAVHGVAGPGFRDAVAHYFRSVEDAARMIEAFPELVLADGTDTPHYYSPHLSLGHREPGGTAICNLYSQTKSQEAMRRLFPDARDLLGNLQPLPGIYPDMAAPIVRPSAEGRELVLARWGMPTPPQYLGGKRVDRGVTNIRRVDSPHWRAWLGQPHRCLVPVTSFAEYETLRDGARAPVWFALGEHRPLAFFAGVWTRWRGTRKVKEGEIEVDLFGFLTTTANAEVRPIHSQAMPVILTEPAEWEAWLTAPWSEARALQRPLPDGTLRIVARGDPEDPVPAP